MRGHRGEFLKNRSQNNSILFHVFHYSQIFNVIPPLDYVRTGKVSVTVQMPARYINIKIEMIIKSKMYKMKYVQNEKS